MNRASKLFFVFSLPALLLLTLGGLLNFAVILFGLGALWLWGREHIAPSPLRCRLRRQL